MTFLEKLELLMKEKKIKNLHDLSNKSNIPYSTLRGFYTKGTENLKLSTLKKLGKFFNCSIDYLGDDDITEIKPYGDNNLIEEIELLQKVLEDNNFLNEEGILTNDRLNEIIHELKKK